MINGETRSFDKDEDTKDLNWFAFSPSISPGCSIADPFDVLVAHAVASELAAGPRYWQQMLHRVRTLRKNLVLFKIENKGVPRLSLSLEDIRREKERGEKWLSEADVEVKEEVLENSSFAENAIYNEQQLRFSGYFTEKFFEWKSADGATFDYLALSSTAEEALAQKTLTKETKQQEREKNLNSIASAEIVYDSFNIKGDPFAEKKKLHLEKHGIPLSARPADIFRHMQRFYFKDTVQNFSWMLCKTPKDIPEQFCVKRKVFMAIIEACGFKDIRDDRVFYEKKGHKVDTSRLKIIMDSMQEGERLFAELEVKKAKKNGPKDAYTWAKYALNRLGSHLGICNRNVRLMVGESSRRIWSLRGIQGSKPCPDLFCEMIELSYIQMKQGQHISSFYDQLEDAFLLQRSNRWSCFLME